MPEADEMQPKASMNVDLPTPGAPDTPIRTAVARKRGKFPQQCPGSPRDRLDGLIRPA